MSISIIVCSIKPELCNQMLKSVKNTIGVDFETIIFDNREKNIGICQVYNLCAKKAKFPYLCLIHEDVVLSTPDWGMTMVSFAQQTPDCGVIGFAGGTIAKKNFAGWSCGSKGRYRYYDHDTIPGGKTYAMADLSCKYNNPDNEKFAKVVTLDGFFLLVKKDIWEENPFDEEEIKGFHFYDADFSFSIAQKRQNYACLTADIYHFSGGYRDRGYCENARIFQKKWKSKLPCIIGRQKISLIEEFIDTRKLLVQSVLQGFKIGDSVKHIREINGWRFLFMFMGYMLMHKIYKLVLPYNIKKIIRKKNNL